MADPRKPLAKLQSTIAALERKRGSRVFCMIHGRGGHICDVHTIDEVIRHRREFRKGKILDILIPSPGGSPDAAYRLIKFLRRRYEKVNAIVPLKAKSAATLMCLGADRISMGEFAQLGPVDIQIVDPLERGAESFSPLDEFKSMEFMRDYAVEILDFFTGLFLERSGNERERGDARNHTVHHWVDQPLYSQIDPLEMGEHRRSLAIGEEYATRLLNLTRNPNVDKIVEKLVWQYPSHNDWDSLLLQSGRG